MKYLLVVGFACEVYKKEPRARIFIVDKLIDEFYIQHHKDTIATAIKKSRQDKQLLQPFLQPEFVNIQIKNFTPLRFYEIELDTTLDQVELRIEIKNSDSNYTNGFITNSTLIKLQVCYFFPLHKKLLLRLEKIRNKIRLQNYAWCRSPNNIIFDLLQNKLQWQGKNGQIVDYVEDKIGNYPLGGDGVFIYKLVKKYQILISKLKKSSRYNFNTVIVNYLVNKYNEYANQRNTE